MAEEKRRTSAAGVSFGMIPYNSPTGERAVPGVILPPGPAKPKASLPIGIEPKTAAPQIDITKGGQVPLAGTGLESEGLVSSILGPNPNNAPLDYKTKAPEIAAAPVVEKTAVGGLTPAQQLASEGFETRIGGVGDTAALREGAGGMNTPTGFRWKDEKGNIITPEAGTKNWSNKLRGMNNVTLEMKGVPSALTNEEKVTRTAQNEVINKGAGYGISLNALTNQKGHEATQAIHKEGLMERLAIQRENLARLGKNDEADAEEKATKNLLTVYGQKDMDAEGKMALNDRLTFARLAETAGDPAVGKFDLSKLDRSPLLKEGVENYIQEFNAYVERARGDEKNKGLSDTQLRARAWNVFKEKQKRQPQA